MTDTGQVPGEGLPESAGMVEQPGVPAPGAYTYLSETAAEDEDLLLPGAQGAWGNEMPPPAPEPVVQVVHEPGPHEMSGRDSGSHDLSAVRTPVATPVPQPPVARRPLHLGPPTPDASASPVRSLADRGPADAPVPPSAARQPGPAATGPEYLDVPPQTASQWVGAPAPAAPAPGVATGGAAEETVVPQEEQISVAVAETPLVADAPDELQEAQDPEALHQAQDAAYALAQEAAMAQFRAPEAVGTPVAAQLQATETVEAPAAAEPQPLETAEAAAAAAQSQTPEAVEATVPAQPHAPEAAEGLATVQPRAPEASDGLGAVQPQAPEAADGLVDVQPQAPEAAVMPSAPEAAEVPPAGEATQTPQVEVEQAPEPVETAAEAQAPEGSAPEEVGPAASAAQVPDATPFPPAAQDPDPAQAAAEAQDVPQVQQEPEEGAEPVDASVPPQVAEADALPQDDAATPTPADAAVPPTMADDAEQAVAASEQPAPTAAADQQAVADVPDPEIATAAPDQESAVGAPDAQAENVVPDAAQDPAPAQDQQQPTAQAPVAEEPQPTEAGAAEAQPVEAAQPQPEAVAEEAQPLESAQPEPQPAVQGPQAAEPVAPAADVAAVADQVAQVADSAPQPEAEQPSVAESVLEAEAEADATDATAADQATDAHEPAPVEQPTGEAPNELADPATDPAATDPAAMDPSASEPPVAEPPVAEPPVAEPPVVESPAPVPSQIDAPQGAVVQTPAEPAPETPLADAPQEPHPDADQPLGQFVPVEGSVPTTPHLAPTPPGGTVVPPLPADDQVTPVAAEFPAAEGQPEAADEAPEAAEPMAIVPAPRDSEAETIVVSQPLAAADDADPQVVQYAADLDTRAADQEDSEAAAVEAVAAAEESTAPVDEAPEDVREDVGEEVRQPTGPAAPPYEDAEREAVLKVMRERRDIRNGFRGDPIPHDVLLRVLEAAHTAPSVGHSQPWDFVVIRSAETRRTMHELAQRQREAYAKSLPKGRAKQFKELKIEAILDTPVNIVVTADPTRGGRHTLGRHTQPQMAPYSSALAVENLWLAARAEGLGVGWVSFFDEREMVRALGLPEHLEVVAYLCVGYVDEFPEEPELMQAGWAKRRPLSWVVHEETYGRRALPGAEPHDLLAETVAGIRPLDAKALGEAWERQKRMTKPAGALGMLEIISAQLSGLSRQCPPPIPEPAAVAIFAGDHGVHAQGVTPWPQEVTAQMVANFLGGGAVCNAFATQVGAEVCVVDVGVASDLPATPGLLPRKVRAGTSDMTTGPAMTREEAKKAIEVGIETARDLVAAGNKGLITGEMGIANTTASAALISVFTGADPAEVTGRGTGINDETLARKTEVVRRAIELHQPDPADPIGVLAAIGGFEHAAIVGLLLGGASLRTPVILDGVSAGAAALVARAIAPEVLAACIAGHRSAEPGHVAALQKLGLRPLVDLDLRLGEGTGALLALPVVQSAARAMHEVATFDSAGVTEK